MPIHDFKKIEEVEKEIEDGKAQIIRPKPKSESRIEPKSKPKPDSKIEIVQETPKKVIQKTIQKKEIRVEKTSHPMICGSLEIEEEEL